MLNLKDPNYIFQLEKNITKILFLLVIGLMALLFVAIIAISFLLPLKEKQPYLVFFSEPQSTFFRIETQGFNVRSDIALLKSIIAGYVSQRETINHIDEAHRFRVIAQQSNNKVYSYFEKLVTPQNSIYQNHNYYREIEIINTQIISQNISIVEFMAKTRIGETDEKIQRYKATIKYDFVSREVKEEAINLNPTGFIVTEYALSKVYINDEEKKK